MELSQRTSGTRGQRVENVELATDDDGSKAINLHRFVLGFCCNSSHARTGVQKANKCNCGAIYLGVAWFDVWTFTWILYCLGNDIPRNTARTIYK